MSNVHLISTIQVFSTDLFWYSRMTQPCTHSAYINMYVPMMFTDSEYPVIRPNRLFIYIRNEDNIFIRSLNTQILFLRISLNIYRKKRLQRTAHTHIDCIFALKPWNLARRHKYVAFRRIRFSSVRRNCLLRLRFGLVSTISLRASAEGCHSIRISIRTVRPRFMRD